MSEQPATTSRVSAEINVWIACALDEAGMLTLPAEEDRHVDQ